MITISKSKLKAHMLEIFRKIEQTGEELVVTDHNNPVLKIIPYMEKYSANVIFKDFQGKVIYNENITSVTTDEWEIS